MLLQHDDSTINIVLVLLLFTIIKEKGKGRDARFEKFVDQPPAIVLYFREDTN